MKHKIADYKNKAIGYRFNIKPRFNDNLYSYFNQNSELYEEDWVEKTDGLEDYDPNEEYNPEFRFVKNYWEVKNDEE